MSKKCFILGSFVVMLASTTPALANDRAPATPPPPGLLPDTLVITGPRAQVIFDALNDRNRGWCFVETGRVGFGERNSTQVDCIRYRMVASYTRDARTGALHLQLGTPSWWIAREWDLPATDGPCINVARQAHVLVGALDILIRRQPDESPFQLFLYNQHDAAVGVIHRSGFAGKLK
jgi:hypothetical protein